MEFAAQTRGSYDMALETALWAEYRDLAAIALPDHYLPVIGDNNADPAYDHFIHFGGLARETKTIELVSLVAPVTFRHPAVLYKMAVTLDEVSGGRFTLGLGTGWLEDEFKLFGLDYPTERERLELREEAMAYLVAAISPTATGYTGATYSLAEFDPHPHPQNLRLLIGGGGMVKTPRIAGTYADEFNIYACPPEDFRIKAERAREVAAKAGRDPDRLLISCAGPAIAAGDKSDFERLKNEMAELVGIEPKRLTSGYEKHQYPHGWGGQPSEMIAALEGAGCQRFYMQLFLGDRADYDLILQAYQGLT